MPNVANVLKSEIARVARKEIREHTESLKKGLVATRAEIALLKKRLAEAEKQVLQLQRLRLREGSAATATAAAARAGGPQTPSHASGSADSHRSRPASSSAEALLALRKRLGLTQAQLGSLVGASSLSVWKWETGQVHPRERYLQAYAQLRSLGKRELARRLEASVDAVAAADAGA